MPIDTKAVGAVHCHMGTPSRPYVMTARAQATERTRCAILLAGLERAHETMSVDVPLADVAGRAGVSVQTVLRHFGELFPAIFNELKRQSFADVVPFAIFVIMQFVHECDLCQRPGKSPVRE